MSVLGGDSQTNGASIGKGCCAFSIGPISIYVVNRVRVSDLVLETLIGIGQAADSSTPKAVPSPLRRGGSTSRPTAAEEFRSRWRGR